MGSKTLTLIKQTKNCCSFKLSKRQRILRQNDHSFHIESQWGPKQHWTPVTFIKLKKRKYWDIFFCVAQKKERHTRLERHLVEYMRTEWSLSNSNAQSVMLLVLKNICSIVCEHFSARVAIGDLLHWRSRSMSGRQSVIWWGVPVDWLTEDCGKRVE